MCKNATTGSRIRTREEAIEGPRHIRVSLTFKIGCASFSRVGHSSSLIQPKAPRRVDPLAHEPRPSWTEARSGPGMPVGWHASDLIAVKSKLARSV